MLEAVRLGLVPKQGLGVLSGRSLLSARYLVTILQVNCLRSIAVGRSGGFLVGSQKPKNQRVIRLVPTVGEHNESSYQGDRQSLGPRLVLCLNTGFGLNLIERHETSSAE